MKTIRLILGSILVYLSVAAIYACAPSGHPGSVGSGAGTAGSATGVGGSTGTVAPAMADESGSRIEVVYLIGDDGSKVVPTYYDKQRKEYCNTYPASDGRIHCMPYSGALTSASSDPGCSSPVASVPSCSPAPKYVLSAVGAGGCSVAYHEYASGIPLPASAPIYYGTPGACGQAEAQPPSVTYYSLGAEVPPSAFVGFTPQAP